MLLRRRPGRARSRRRSRPGNRYVGVLLPYTPLHHLLVAEVAAPIVLTSGNLSDEPIAYRDAGPLRPVADAVLDHDRAIHTRADDSVVRVERGRVLPIRRSRGYAPEPLALAAPVRRPVLGCGAELKSTFCLARGPHAFLSHHIGDLENAETLRSFTEGVAHYRRLFDVEPAVVAHDLHPEYLSTKYAHGASRGVELVGVQHHHAHLASCLADNGEAGPVVGLACDGLGYGTDGALWGGEVMEVSLTGFRRLAHLEEVPLPGGATAIRQPWRMAAAWLRAAGIDGDGLAVARRNPGWATVGRLLDSRLDVPVTTSVGRLFDAVAALVGVRDAVNYEGQAAIELEQAADEWLARAAFARVGTESAARMSRSGRVRRLPGPGRGRPAARVRPAPRGRRRPARRGRRPGDRRPVPRRPRRPARPRGRRRLRRDRPRHRRPLRRRLPERAAAAASLRGAGRRRPAGAHPLPGAAERRRREPGAGGRRGGPGRGELNGGRHSVGSGSMSPHDQTDPRWR